MMMRCPKCGEAALVHEAVVMEDGTDYYRCYRCGEVVVVKNADVAG